MLAGLTRAIAGKGPRIVAKESYEFTGLRRRLADRELKASGADTLMLFATPKFFIQAVVATHKLAWKPRLYIASVSIEPGIMAIARAQRARADEGRALDRVREEPERPDLGEGQGGRALPHDHAAATTRPGRVTDVYNWYGMTVAWTMVETLRKAGTNLTRAGLLRAAQSLEPPGQPVPAPGHPPADLADGLPPHGARLPVPLRQQAVGARRAGSCMPAADPAFATLAARHI